MPAARPFRLVAVASIIAAAFAFPASGKARFVTPRPAAPKPAVASITLPSEGDLTIARITLQAKPGATIRPKLSVTNGNSLDPNLRVFGSLKAVKGVKGRFQAWVLVVLSAAPQSAPRAAVREALLAPLGVGFRVTRSKLLAGGKGLKEDEVVDPVSLMQLDEFCAGDPLPGTDAAGGLLFGKPIPDLSKPSIEKDVCGQTLEFWNAAWGTSTPTVTLGVGPHGQTNSPFRGEVTARPNSAIYMTIDAPGAGAFVDSPGNSILYQYRMLGIEGEQPFGQGTTCAGAQIQLFGTYDVTTRIESFGQIDTLSETLAVGPANNPIADCPVTTTDPSPTEVKPSWCYWPDGVGLFQVYVKGTPGSRIHAEIEGPAGSEGGTLAEAARTTKLPASGQLVFRTNVFKIGEYEVKIGNVFGKPTFEATVETAGESPASPAQAHCPDVM